MAARLQPAGPGEWRLSGTWTVAGLGTEAPQLPEPDAATVLDGAALGALGSEGAWVLQAWVATAAAPDAVQMRAWPAPALVLLQQVRAGSPLPAVVPRPAARRGLGGLTDGRQALALVAFIGSTGWAGLGALRR